MEPVNDRLPAMLAARLPTLEKDPMLVGGGLRPQDPATRPVALAPSHGPGPGDDDDDDEDDAVGGGGGGNIDPDDDEGCDDEDDDDDEEPLHCAPLPGSSLPDSMLRCAAAICVMMSSMRRSARF